MKLIFAGSGSAFTVGANNYQSNMVLETDAEERLLIDCGSDARLSLYDLGLTYRDIQHVFISHLHVDHVGGLEWLAFTTFFDKECPKPTLYISSQLVEDLWNNVLSGGLDSLEGEKAELSTYFNVIPLDGTKIFNWKGIKMHPIRTYHVVSAHAFSPTYGLLFESNGKKILISTDTQFMPEKMMDHYTEADVIFHDCETTLRPSGVHSHYSQLLSLDPKIKKKVWLYHYSPGPLPDAVKDGFCGFVAKGQSFEF